MSKVLYPDGVVLPSQHPLFLDCIFHDFGKIEHCRAVEVNQGTLPAASKQIVLIAFCFTYNACFDLSAYIELGQAEQSYLQGLPCHHTDAIPTWGALCIVSRSGTPAAYSIA